MSKILALVMFIGTALFSGVASASSVYEAWITDGTMTGGQYTDRTDSVFSLTETPYVFISLPDSLSSVDNVKATWWNDGADWSFVGTDKSGSLTALLTLDWKTVTKTAGLWTVQADYSAPGSIGSKTLNFTFAPEPVSAGLFLLGGGALAFLRRKQKK